jgi:hypothetical protein
VTLKPLDVVVLQQDYPSRGLKRGDLGTIVEIYGPDQLEVEFVRASGETEALITVKTADVRAVARNDLIAVRSLSGAA